MRSSGVIRVPVAGLRRLVRIVRVVLVGPARLIIWRKRFASLIGPVGRAAIRVEGLVRSVRTVAGGRGVGGCVGICVAGRVPPATTWRERREAHDEIVGGVKIR